MTESIVGYKETSVIPAVRKDYQSFLAGQLLTGTGSSDTYENSIFYDGSGIVGDAQKFAEKARDDALSHINDLQAQSANLASIAPPSIGSIPDAPTFSAITVPGPPDIEYGYSTDLTFPNIENLEPPTVPTLPGGVTVPAEIITQLKNEFFEGLDPEGYSPSVEQAIYDRARTRREADLKQKKDDAASQLAQRGFPAPPGTLHALNLRYDIEAHREETDLNRDIVRTQADLIRQRYERILELGQQLFQNVLSKEELESRMELERATKQYQFALDRFSSELRKAEAQGSIAQTEAQYLASKMQIEQVRVEAYRAQVQGKQVQAEAQKAEAEAYAAMAQAKGYIGRAEADLYRAEAEVLVSQNQINQQAASDAANVASQLAASAMSAVSASVQLSGTQSDSASTGYQMSLGRQDGYYINEQKTSSTA